MPFNLTPVGAAHTAVALVSLLFGFWSLLRHGEVLWTNRSGAIYLLGTMFAATTAFAIFQHGGFGRGHIIAGVTLAAILVGTIISLRKGVTGIAAGLRTFVFSATFLFHALPGATETLTRFPVGHPFAASPDAPALRPVFLALAGGFLILVTVQLFMLARKRLN